MQVRRHLRRQRLEHECVAHPDGEQTRVQKAFHGEEASLNRRVIHTTHGVIAVTYTGNPLALAVLATLWQKPMHPYEMARTLRRQGKDTSTKINYGSLYTVVQNLQKHGFVKVTDVERQGNRPERTIYGLTDEGREELTEWMSDLLAVPAKEYPIFETALSLLGALPPDEVVRLLAERLQSLEVEVASGRAALEKLCETLPRLFLVEVAHGSLFYQ